MPDKPLIAIQCSTHFESHFKNKPTVLSWAPGRINIIGEHTDYNNGLALPAAINRYVVVAITPRQDDRVVIHSYNYTEDYEFSLKDLAQLTPNKLWHKYIVGGAHVFQSMGQTIRGMDVLIEGDIPAGSGLSSSAALVLAWLGALTHFGGAKLDAWELVRASQRVEHEFLGVKCGLLDQIGSQMSVAGQVLAVDFQSLEVVPTTYNLPGYSWVAIHTGKSRELAESAYQDRVKECKEALAKLSHQYSHIENMRDVSEEMLAGNDTLSRRVRHVIRENTRVEQALQYIQNDALALGQLLDESHKSLRDDYEVSCDELNAMVQIAQAHDACLGSRMMGGGFGGSTLSLVEAGRAQTFVDETIEKYLEVYPDLKPSALIAELVAGAASTSV